jgi:hypothetical protein
MHVDRGLRDRLGILAPLYTRNLQTGQAESEGDEKRGWKKDIMMPA